MPCHQVPGIGDEDIARQRQGHTDLFQGDDREDRDRLVRGNQLDYEADAGNGLIEKMTQTTGGGGPEERHSQSLGWPFSPGKHPWNRTAGDGVGRCDAAAWLQRSPTLADWERR